MLEAGAHPPEYYQQQAPQGARLVAGESSLILRADQLIADALGT
jgi:hypothetical protein